MIKTSLECTDYFTKSQNWRTAGEDTQYLIENYDGKVIVAFQGSNSKIDWINNFRFWKKPYKDMEVSFRVHSGFLKAWKACRDTVMKEIEECNPTEILITGHSYGGAIAALCMEDCWFRFIKNRPEETSLKGKIKCITFGAPRILGLLNYSKVKDRWEGTTLFNNKGDIVPTVPPCFFFYRHVTEQTYLGHLKTPFSYFNPGKYHMFGEGGYKERIEEVVFGK